MTKKKAPHERLKLGRPETEIFNETVADKILDMLADGLSLRAICRTNGLPSGSVIRKWLARNPDFAKQYAYAREEQADTLFDETLAIADAIGDDATNEQIRKAQLQIDTRKWLAGKLRPKKYGDASKHETSGDGNVTMQQINIGKLDYDDREALADMLKLISPGESTNTNDDL